MNNREVAAIFEEIADILDIQGENPFKVRAYRKAAQVIESLPEELARVQAEGRLQQLEGIGEAIAKKIEELLTTGRLEYYEKQKASIPEGLLGLLEVPELGPKKAKLLYDKLGITSIEQLEEAAKTEKIRGLPGMGAKTEQNILKGIEVVKRGKGRALLGDALRVAEEIVAGLKKVRGVSQLVPAGSLRRMQETVGDIDILAISGNPEKVMDAFVSLSCVAEVLAKGPTKSSIRTKDDMQVDVRVVPKESFGAALQYFTGSKAHNILVRSLAQKRGLKVNEYGVFDEKSDKMVAGATEEEVYGALSLDLIPPELRQGTDEIEAAAAHKLPKLIELKDIKGDLQVHTTWSDGKASLKDVAEAARARGYDYVGITDHSASLTVAHGLSPERVEEQLAEITDLNKKMKPFRIFAGTEVEIKADGSLDFENELLEKFDFVMAAVHSSFKQDKAIMTARICRALENPNVDIMAHPTGRLIGKRDSYDLDVEEILKGAARTGTALEINGHQMRLDLRDMHARQARDLGVIISINTDAHVPAELDMMRLGVGTARRAWLGPEHVLNHLTASKLAKFFKTKKAKRCLSI